jgi:hypothetical protein
MLTPTEACDEAAAGAQARCELTATAIAGLALHDYIDQQTQGENSSVTLLNGCKWDAIELAAKQLNDAGWVVEWGYALTGHHLDRRHRAIRIMSREDFIEQKVGEIGSLADLGVLGAAAFALLGLGLKWLFIPAVLLLINWLVSLKTRGSKRYRLRVRLLAQEWTPIACQSQDNAIKI